jgi:hypothetical protein
LNFTTHINNADNNDNKEDLNDDDQETETVMNILQNSSYNDMNDQEKAVSEDEDCNSVDRKLTSKELEEMAIEEVLKSKEKTAYVPQLLVKKSDKCGNEFQRGRVNDAMYSQKLLKCSEACNVVLGLVSSVLRTARKQSLPLKIKKDINLAVATLDKVTNDLEEVCSRKLLVYAKECRKRCKIDEEDVLVTSQSNGCQSFDLIDVCWKKCEFFVKKEESTHGMSLRNSVKQIAPQKILKFKKCSPMKRYKEIKFPFPRNNYFYLPKELCENLDQYVGKVDRYFVLKSICDTSYVNTKLRNALRIVKLHDEGKSIL